MDSGEEKVSNAASGGQEHVPDIYESQTQENAEQATASATSEEKAKEAEAKILQLFEAEAGEHADVPRYDYDYPVVPGQADVADGTEAVADEIGHNMPPGLAIPNDPHLQNIPAHHKDVYDFNM